MSKRRALLASPRAMETLSPRLASPLARDNYGWSIMLLSMWGKNVPLSFCSTNLILELDLAGLHTYGVWLILRSSPTIETLRIMVNEDHWAKAYVVNGDAYWDYEKATLPHLETIQIDGYRKEPCLIKMVKCLVTSAPSLQKMVIFTKRNVNLTGQSEFTPEQLSELLQKLPRLPRASTEATICVS